MYNGFISFEKDLKNQKEQRVKETSKFTSKLDASVFEMLEDDVDYFNMQAKLIARDAKKFQEAVESQNASEIDKLLSEFNRRAEKWISRVKVAKNDLKKL